ncbi:hypothetical protein PPYR_00797 [Photinus pyralis]|uniref:Uncharacterized protein n=1 Tax=Photinus pyralis TaxID=7054 RepID=A0A5N4B2K1_PHOPY|nr:hypothetical protein PPYR_00797 [Photinus pyralis]
MDRRKRYTSSTYRQSKKKKMQRMRNTKLDRTKDVPMPLPSFSQTLEVSSTAYAFPSTSQITVEQEDENIEENIAFEPENNSPDNIADMPGLQENIVGRRVINIAHFFRQILTNELHQPFNCSLVNMEIMQERRNGLKSEFVLKCKMCGVIQTISSENCTDDSLLDINTSAVLSAISTGIGHSNLEEIHAAMAIPSISNRLYSQHHSLLAETIHKSAWMEMEIAGKEEKRMAEEVGEVDENGIPLVSVIADGAWCKRSYGTNYAANSGVGCIIGVRSQKLLYIGIRNKYCIVCELYMSKGVDIPDHTCFKNWKGTSTSMEADIIVEGFRRSMEIHGIIYNKLIGDGDSSVSKKLLEAKPYGNRVVKKVECRNHLLRNFCKKLVTLTKNTRSSYSNTSVPPLLRQKLKTSVMRLRMAIVKAIDYRKSENVDDNEKTNNLKKDITNSPSHIFGSHSECAQYFCSGAKQNERNFVTPMKECGLFQDIINRKKMLKSKRRLIPESRRKKTKPIELEDEDYGPLAAEIPNPEKSDMDPESYNSQKALFVQKLKKTNAEIKDIEFRTRGQSSNTVWKQERSIRLTASNFGKICKMRSTTSCVSSVKLLLYSSFTSSKSTDYGITHEPVAKLSFAKQFDFKVNECGFFIGSGELYFLGASPDGVIDKIVDPRYTREPPDNVIRNPSRN